MDSLEEDIDYLTDLSSARSQARALRSKGIKVLLPKPMTPRDHRVRWDDEGGISGQETSRCQVVPVLLKRIKHLAWMLDEYPKEVPSDARDASLPSLRVSSLFGEDPADTPIFYAAQYLRAAIDEPTGNITSDSILCYYRILRELYNVNAPYWVLGAARTGEYVRGSGPPSAFVTNECARAINGLRLKISNTAEYLQHIVSALQFCTHVERCQEGKGFAPLSAAWCTSEIERSLLEMRVRSEHANSRTLLNVRLPMRNGSVVLERRALTAAIFKAVKHLVVRTSSAIDHAIADIEGYRAREFEVSRRKTKSHIESVRLIESRMFRESEPGHRAAIDSLLPTQELLNDLASKATHSFVKQVELCDQLRGVCQRVAGGIGEMLEPTRRYAESVCRHSLAEIDATGSMSDMPELAFAASCAASLGKNWEDPIYKKTLAVLGASLDVRGRFPPGRPFHLADHGLQLNAINAHAIRAFVQLIGYVPGPISPQWTKRIIRYFEDEFVSIGEGKQAWGRGRGVRRLFPAAWVTAATTLALHRLVSVLNRKINEGVYKHFNIQTHSAIVIPEIEKLMCSEVGLSTVMRQSKVGSGTTLTIDLTLMLAHLLGVRCAKSTGYDDVYSVVLYGPPGTGKTSLVESLARTAKRTLVSVSPSDFIVHGAERVEKRASDVMRALSMLTDSVVLFDEFDTVLRARDLEKEPPHSPLAFLSGSMLPKIKALRASAERNRVVYALATNYYDRLDEAAVRPGRFDYRIGVYPPDPQSRLCRLVSQMRQWCAAEQIQFSRSPRKPAAGAKVLGPRSVRTLESRIAYAVSRTSGVPVVELAKRGWFTAPDGMRFGQKSLWAFLVGGLVGCPACEESDVSWPLPVRRHKYEHVDLLYDAEELSELEEDEKQRALLSDLVLKQVTVARIAEKWNKKVAEFVEENGERWTQATWRALIRLLVSKRDADKEIRRLDMHVAWLRTYRLGSEVLKDHIMIPHPGRAKVPPIADRSVAAATKSTPVANGAVHVDKA